MSRRISIFNNIDWLTVFIYIFLVVFGWLNIYSVNYSESNPWFFSPQNRYAMQLYFIIAAAILGIVLLLIDSHFYSFISYPAYGFTIFMLLAVLLIGREVNGSKSWIILGPVALQPSEFAKTAVILALARFLSGYNIKASSTKNMLLSLAIIFTPPLFIMLQPDFGSTLVYGALVIVLYREGLPGWILLTIFYLAAIFLFTLMLSKLAILILLIVTALIIYLLLNKSFKNLAIAIGILSGSLIAGIILRYFGIYNANNYLLLFSALLVSTVVFLALSIAAKAKNILPVVVFLFSFIGFVYSVDFVFHSVLKKHQQERVQIMLGLKSDPWGYEYNVNQSKIAIGSGGFFGRGFLKGPQTKLKYVPEQSTDFIFCTIGEEWGFLGSLALVGIFVGLLIRLIIIAERQRSRFSRIYAYGVVAVILFHFAINIAMTLAIFPVIGIPLPFISYGGSSLLAFTAMLFILLKLDSTRKAYLV